MDLATLVGALPDLGSLGIALVLITLDRRWFSAERAEWRTERAALLAEAAAARAEAREARQADQARTAPVPIVGRHGVRSPSSSQSSA